MPESSVAAAPAAPAAPPAPSTPAAAPPSSGAVEVPASRDAPSPIMKESIDALRKLAGNEPEKDAPKEAPKPDKEKETAKEPPKPTTEKDAKPPEKEAPKPDADVPVEKMAPKALRDAYTALKQKHSTAEKELTELKQRAPKAAEPASPEEHPKFKEMQKRVEEAEQHLRFKDYEQSSEFKEKYDAPYKQAWAANSARAQQFMVKVQKENELGEKVDGGTRAVTGDEFWSIVRASDNEAIELADKLFPDSPSKSAKIQQLAEDVRMKGHALQTALFEAKKNGAEREKQTIAQRQAEEQKIAAQSKARVESWKQLVEADRTSENKKEFFVAADDDAKGKEILTKGFKLADKAFGLVDEGEAQPTDDELVEIHAAVRNMAGSWPYMKHQLGVLKSQLAEAQKELDQFKKSDPPGDTTIRDTNASETPTIDLIRRYANS